MNKIIGGTFQGLFCTVLDKIASGYKVRLHDGTETVIHQKDIEKKGLDKVCYVCHKKHILAKIHVLCNRNICVTCLPLSSARCSVCGQVHLNENVRVVDGLGVCTPCLGRRFITCRVCGRIERKQETMVAHQLDHVCSTCAPSLERCGCGRHVEANSMRTGLDSDRLCDTCFNRRYAVCGGCSRTNYREDVRLVGSRYLCGTCHDELPIREYSYSPRRLHFNKMAWENTLYLGMELEVECEEGGDRMEVASRFRKHLRDIGMADYFYLKNDGSLSNGFEIVSHPFTVQYKAEKMDFSRMLKWLEVNKCTSYNSGRCGLHVHMNRDHFTPADVKKLRVFFARTQEKLRKFSMRKGVGETYAQFERWDAQGKARIMGGQNPGGRFWAVNVNSSKPTIEIRMFRGTLKHSRITASLQFCDAVAHFVKEVGFGMVVNGDVWVAFKVWANAKNRYGKMMELFSKLAI